MAVFPTRDWMDSFAAILTDHPQADQLMATFVGRYRFVITPSRGFDQTVVHDLVVSTDGIVAEPGGNGPVVLTVTANHDRWKDLVTGKADFVRTFLLRRLKVDGDIMALRKNLAEAKVLLACLQSVPTEFTGR